MVDSKSDSINLKKISSLIGLIIAICSAIGGVVAAHFDGIEASKSYTDKKISEAKVDLNQRLDRMEGKQDQILEFLLNKK